MRRYEHLLSLAPRFTGLRFDTFPGGCVTYRFSFAPGASRGLVSAAASALSSVSSPGPRSSMMSGAPKA